MMYKLADFTNPRFAIEEQGTRRAVQTSHCYSIANRQSQIANLLDQPGATTGGQEAERRHGAWV
jgi:hypothetical protein